MNPTQNTQNTPVASPTPPVSNVTPPPSSAPGPKPDEKSNSSWLKPLYIVIAVCFILIVTVLGWLTYNSLKKPAPSVPKASAPAETQAEISGNVVFQGYAPADAYITIATRVAGKGNFSQVASDITPGTSSAAWNWDDAIAGKNYEVQAQLEIKGVAVQTSVVSTVSAPASDVNLIIVSEENPPQPATTQISGVINLNGYVPQGANINLTADATSGAGGQTTIPSIVATDSATWSWSSAVVGTTYDITAQLVDQNGNSIAPAVSSTITAPASGIEFAVNSTAQPPAPVITGLSGNININGSIPSNSYITLGTRVTGTQSFNQVASNIQATDNVAWSWAQAQSGTSYDMQAYLWVNNQPYAQSQILTAAAPADDEILTINAQQTTSAPSGSTMNVNCNGQQSGAFQATINYNTAANLSNATSYNIIVTLASQGSQVLNTTVAPPSPTQVQSLTTTYIFTSGATYYAQYAYAQSGNSTFSPLSPAIQFSCR